MPIDADRLRNLTQSQNWTGEVDYGRTKNQRSSVRAGSNFHADTTASNKGEEELLALLDTLHDRGRRIRIHALFLAKMGYCHTRSAIARALHRDRKTVERWFIQYEREGLQALLSSQRSRCGKKARIQGEALARLQARLAQPEGFHGYHSICTWLKEQFGLDVPYKTVHGTVRYRLQGSPKVPRKSNVKKDPQRAETLKKKPLPRS